MLLSSPLSLSLSLSSHYPQLHSNSRFNPCVCQPLFRPTTLLQPHHYRTAREGGEHTRARFETRPLFAGSAVGSNERTSHWNHIQCSFYLLQTATSTPFSLNYDLSHVGTAAPAPAAQSCCRHAPPPFNLGRSQHGNHFARTSQSSSSCRRTYRLQRYVITPFTDPALGERLHLLRLTRLLLLPARSLCCGTSQRANLASRRLWIAQSYHSESTCFSECPLGQVMALFLAC